VTALLALSTGRKNYRARVALNGTVSVVDVQGGGCKPVA
jgi:hypothetical protein